MKRTLLAMALLVTSVFGVTGCGSDDGEAPVESRIKNSTGDPAPLKNSVLPGLCAENTWAPAYEEDTQEEDDYWGEDKKCGTLSFYDPEDTDTDDNDDKMSDLDGG